MHFILLGTVLSFLTLSLASIFPGHSSKSEPNKKCSVETFLPNKTKSDEISLHDVECPSHFNSLSKNKNVISKMQIVVQNEIITERKKVLKKVNIINSKVSTDDNTGFDSYSEEPLPQPTFNEGNKINPWPHTAFRDFAVSFLSLYRLTEIEYKFYLILKYEVRKFKRRLNSETIFHVNRYINKYETEVLESIRSWNVATNGNKSVKDILNHPFLILKLLRRCVFEFIPLYNAVKASDEVNLKHIPPEMWPTLQDFIRFVKLIEKFQFTYDFDFNKLVRGQFGSVETTVNLNSSDITIIGYMASHSGNVADGVNWMRAAFLPLSEGKTITNDDLARSFSLVADQHDAYWTKISTDNFFVFKDKVNRTLDKNVKQVTNKFIAQQKFRGYKKFDMIKNQLNFHTLCKRDENWQTEDEKSKLHCWYDKTVAIFPFKYELLHKDPHLMKIHDFVTTSERNHLIQRSYQQSLSVARAAKTDQKKEEQINHHSNTYARAATTAWLYESDKVLTKLEYKIEIVTNLNVRATGSSEPFQVAATLPGGHFILHSDAGEKKKFLPRHATVFIYLNKVLLGGKTAFPILGLSVKPEPRSAVFWYNYMKDGSWEDRMMHGGCPVVLGQKWVTTKWILDKKNEICRK